METDDIGQSHSKFQVEQAGIICRLHATEAGELYLRLEGQFLPSLPNVYFGLHLMPGTTQEEAQVLATQISRYCPAMFAQFMLDGNMDGLPHYEIDEKTGLAKLD